MKRSKKTAGGGPAPDGGGGPAPGAGGGEVPAPKSERDRLYAMLGELPDRHADIACTALSVEEREHYSIERLVLDLNGMEPVPAYFIRPRARAAAYPTILYSHAHGASWGIGKDEIIDGRQELHRTPYAEELARRGYAALAIDHWNFGERRGRTESELFKELIWKGQVLFGLMVYDNLRALDYLVSRPDVDSSRIGALGMSMGSTLSWWTAALDERIAVVADICCLTDFQALIDRRGLDGHGIYYYVPGLLKHFTTAGIQALICPRPHLSLAGDLDPLTPPEGLDRIDRQMKQAYAAADAAGAWRLRRFKVGHVETAQMRQDVLQFFHTFLGGDP